MTARPGSALLWLLALCQCGLTLSLRRQRAADVGLDVNLSRPLSCLRMTTPGLELRYPEDAEQHMEEIREAMLPFQPNPVYGSNTTKLHGEHLWMSLYEVWKARKREGAALSDVFGPYIPIFTHWVEPWFKPRPGPIEDIQMKYPDGFLANIRRVLRKDVPYITMSQNDEGLPGKPWDHFSMSEYPNLLVLSSGGYGHVPTPLWSGHVPTSYRSFFKVPEGPRPRRTYFMSYVGSLEHAPDNMRARMKDVVEQYAATHSLTVSDWPANETFADLARRNAKDPWMPPEPAQPQVQNATASNMIVFFYNRSTLMRRTWHEIMLTSRFSLCPRGYGRTSYHLAETVLSGGIPIHVYTDLPWVPYRKIYETFGFHTDVAGLPELMDRLRNMPEDEFEAREARAREYAKSHWLKDGMADQILRFMSGRGLYKDQEGYGDLICQKLPDTLT